MILYPASLPIDDVTLIISDIRGNAVLKDEPRFAKALWELTGYALRSTVGEPSGAPMGVSIAPTATLTGAQVADFLEKLAQGAATVLPWQAIAKWGLAALAARL